MLMSLIVPVMSKNTTLGFAPFNSDFSSLGGIGEDYLVCFLPEIPVEVLHYFFEIRVLSGDIEVVFPVVFL